MINKYIIALILVSLSLCCLSCKEQKDPDVLIFATSAEYPPFEYKVHGKLTGFDIDLGRLIAENIGKKVKFKDMQFSAILPAVQSEIADAAIATITITEGRKKNFDFSMPYYVESMSIIFKKKAPFKTKSNLIGKKIACQLGSTMEIWLKEHAKGTEIIMMDNNLQAVEALKAGHIYGVLIDTVQANAFTKKNPELGYKVIAQADTGYAVAFKKGSSLVEQVNQVIRVLEAKGEIEKLKKKYLEVQ